MKIMKLLIHNDWLYFSYIIIKNFNYLIINFYNYQKL